MPPLPQVAGLWQGPTAMTQDFGIVLYRIQLLGFNTIRLPLSFQVSTKVLLLIWKLEYLAVPCSALDVHA